MPTVAIALLSDTATSKAHSSLAGPRSWAPPAPAAPAAPAAPVAPAAPPGPALVVVVGALPRACSLGLVLSHPSHANAAHTSSVTCRGFIGCCACGGRASGQGPRRLRR